MKKIVSVLLGLVCCISLMCKSDISVSAQQIRSQQEIKNTAQGIINWKKLDNGSTVNGHLINSKFLELAGTTPGDWFPIGIGRLGIADDYAGYLSVIKDVVENRYKKSGKLSSVKSTEWHRISLAVLAMGGDPTNIGIDTNGHTINLIADGTYDRGKTVSLGRQGINGWIWGLIALDSKRYEIPQGAFYSRDDIIVEILKQQLSDGGFALTGKVSDPDITAMALQALAPYYNSEKSYTYKQKALGTNITKTIRQVVDESLSCLSKQQLSTGDYKSWGTQNVESTCQVAVALCCLGINPQTDSRFIKNGNTIIDGIMRYRLSNGGFVHSFTYDPDNPASLPDKANSMASEQTLYTMAAIIRQMNSQRTLYDFRPEQNSALKSRISSLKSKISSITSNTDKATLEKLLTEYYAIPDSEKSYVSNYWTLSDASKSKKITLVTKPNETGGGSTVITSENTPGKTSGKTSGETPDKPTSPDKDTTDKDTDSNPEEKPLLYFTDSDKKAVDNLPKELTTEDYVTVIKLLEKINQSEDFVGKDKYLKKLTEAKKKIVAIQKEIDSINSDVLKNLYTFKNISLKDKSTIDGIVNRYNTLSKYDQSKINRWEDVIKAKTKVDNQLRAIVISISCVIVCCVGGFFVFRSIKKRKNAKQNAMEELASEYEEE